MLWVFVSVCDLCVRGVWTRTQTRNRMRAAKTWRAKNSDKKENNYWKKKKKKRNAVRDNGRLKRSNPSAQRSVHTLQSGWYWDLCHLWQDSNFSKVWKINESLMCFPVLKHLVHNCNEKKTCLKHHDTFTPRPPAPDMFNNRVTPL